MSLDKTTELSCYEPWQSSPAGLDPELEKEVGSKHPLYEIDAVSVGRRVEEDLSHSLSFT